MTTSKRIVATIEARMNSTRLPGKVLRPILGKPCLQLLIERLGRAQCLDDIVLATTTNPADQVIEDLAARLGVHCFRGSENDVLDRVLSAARAFRADVLVEITGDCPLIDPAVVDRLVNVYLEGNADFVANFLRQTYPAGFETQVFSTALLEQVAQLTQEPSDREHVSIYIYDHPERFKLCNVESGLPERYWSHWITLDTELDLAVITAIFEALYPSNPGFGVREVCELLDRRPDLVELNRASRPRKEEPCLGARP